MNRLTAVKYKNVTPPAAIIDNAAAVTAIIDTKGAKYLTILIILGALDIAVSALKLQESDDSGMSGAADVPNCDYAAALPAGTADNNIYSIDIPLNGRKRYMDLSLTLGDGAAGSFVTVLSILHGQEKQPMSDTQRGLADSKPD